VLVILLVVYVMGVKLVIIHQDLEAHLALLVQLLPVQMVIVFHRRVHNMLIEYVQLVLALRTLPVSEQLVDMERIVVAVLKRVLLVLLVNIV